MHIIFSPTLINDAREIVQQAVNTGTEINVSLIAEQVQARNPMDNVALEDIEELVVKTAAGHHAAMMFSGTMERRSTSIQLKTSMNGSMSRG